MPEETSGSDDPIAAKLDVERQGATDPPQPDLEAQRDLHKAQQLKKAGRQSPGPEGETTQTTVDDPLVTTVAVHAIVDLTTEKRLVLGVGLIGGVSAAVLLRQQSGEASASLNPVIIAASAVFLFLAIALTLVWTIERRYRDA